MTNLSPTARVQFNTLKIICHEAMTELHERLNEARAMGDEGLARDLIDMIRKLLVRMNEIRAAEIAYLNSTLADDVALKKLQKAIANADAGLNAMKDLVRVLAGATRLIGVLARLVALFP
jgi:hypothetical protein